MKKKAYQIICLILTLAMTACLFVHVSYMYRGYSRLMGFYDLEEDSIDVAVVGTSVTFSDYMPMEAWNDYGIVSYSYCTNVQYENSLRYSVREVHKTQSPQLMVIDIAPFMYEHFAGNELWSDEQIELYTKYNVDSMKYSWDRTKLIAEINKDRGGDIYKFLYYLLDISRYHTNTPVFDRFDNAFNDLARGFEHLPRNVGGLISETTLYEDDGSILPLEGVHMEYFENLLAEVEKYDTEVLFVCFPVLFSDMESIGRKNYMKNYLEECGYTFWDMSKDVETIGLDYEMDFWNSNHCDSLGAEKVTKHFAKLLKEAYDLPDRREDPAYANWHEDYEGWLAAKAWYNQKDLGE